MLRYNSQLALLMFVQIIAFGIVMDKFNGRVSSMKPFIQHLKLRILEGQKKPKIVEVYLRGVIWAILASPFVTIAVWSTFLFIHKYKRAGITVIMLGLAIWLMMYSLLKIKWNNWRFKSAHRLIMLSSYILFAGWQFTMVFMDPENNYNGLSACFLTQNGVCATFIIFINLRTGKFTMRAIWQKFLK